MISQLFWSTIFLYLSSACVVAASTTTQDPQAAAAAAQTLPRRERNLDFLDPPTLAYYLGLDVNTGERLHEAPPASAATHNVAVMFYAQWDRNSHSLAPYWDHMGGILKAGTKKSNLIMGLFDCEMDQTSLTLCHAAGVEHYPTLMFISPSRTFPHKPLKRTLPHTTQFPGHWQYDKSVLDWLRTMQAMTGWKNLWNKASNPKGWWQAASHDPATAKLLPVGIPSSGSGSSSSSGSAASVASSVEFQQQASALKELQAEKQQYEELVVRSAVLLDATLFPVSNPTTGVQDVYAQLNPMGWNATDVSSQVLRTCAMEIALDYCVRVQTHKTNELVALKQAEGTEQTLEELEAELKQMIAAAEPYCDIVEQCVVEGFAPEACKTATCPFQEDAACRYLSACFDEGIQQDYAKAMGIELSKPGSSSESSSKRRGWF